MSVILTDEQESAFARAIDYLGDKRTRPFAMFGLAGTGKTTVLSEVARDVPQAILCTLTGKAASVLRRKTGLDVSTIHSAFYTLVEERQGVKGRKDLRFEKRHECGELADKIILVDECSMINHEMAHDIISTGAKIIACGDPGQLSPVTGTRFFNTPDVQLMTIHRQALESPIIRQAYRVRDDKPYQSDTDKFHVMDTGLSDEQIMMADVILCFTNSTRAIANMHKRNIQGIIHPHPRAGEPVMCLKNASSFNVFNGAVYTLEKTFLEGDNSIQIDVDGVSTIIPWVSFAGVKSAIPAHIEQTTAFDFGYAMTVHKAQGSEWSNVVLIDEYRRREGRKEWLYTAITRAADRITITPFAPGHHPTPQPVFDF